MIKMSDEELMERIGQAERKPLTPEQKAKLKANGEKLKSLSKEELHKQLKEAAEDLY